jgi:hypothetical protein
MNTAFSCEIVHTPMLLVDGVLGLELCTEIASAASSYVSDPRMRLGARETGCVEEISQSLSNMKLSCDNT